MSGLRLPYSFMTAQLLTAMKCLRLLATCSVSTSMYSKAISIGCIQQTNEWKQHSKTSKQTSTHANRQQWSTSSFASEVDTSYAIRRHLPLLYVLRPIHDHFLSTRSTPFPRSRICTSNTTMSTIISTITAPISSVISLIKLVLLFFALTYVLGIGMVICDLRSISSGEFSKQVCQSPDHYRFPSSWSTPSASSFKVLCDTPGALQDHLHNVISSSDYWKFIWSAGAWLSMSFLVTIYACKGLWRFMLGI
jgi:hypothetical protein